MSVFYVLDLDRTLANTEKLYEVLSAVLIRDTNISMDMLNKERGEVEARGESFKLINSLAGLLQSHNSEIDWLQVEQAFIREAHRTEGVLEPYAAQLLKLLDSKQLPYGIITYGNEAWQLAKLEAAGLLNVPHVVTRIKEKGRLLAGWRQEDGSFIIPPAMTHDFNPLTVDSIIFLDDKAVSFKDIPEGVHGVYVRSSTRELLESQKGSLPQDVDTVYGLDGALQLLFPLI